MKYLLLNAIHIVLMGHLMSCSKSTNVETIEIPDTISNIDYSDTTQNLKDAATFPVGVSVSYQTLRDDAKMASLVHENFDELVFNSELKHGAILKSDGTYDFKTADEFMGLAKDLKVYGHVLAWHRHQNTTFLNKLIRQFTTTELLNDPGFENSTTVTGPSWFTLNSGNPKGDATFAINTEVSEVNQGKKALKVINPQAYGTADWRVQLASHQFNTVPGKKYTIKYIGRSASGSGLAMVSVQATDGSGVTHYPGGDKTLGSSWQNITLSFTATKETYRILVSLGKKADTYYLDNFSVSPEEATLDKSLVYNKLDSVFKDYITNVVTKYKSNIRKWEVVNEIFTDQGEIRNYRNSPIPSNNGVNEYGYFLWSEYFGRNYGYLAFKYAKEADPTAELYINDYGLEYSDKKIDSLIAYVTEIRKKGAKVDGIGTQLHTDIYLSQDRIDKMFQKLASTGLKVKVSELDIRVTNSKVPVQPTDSQLDKQREQYQRIVASYVKFVPPSQRAGITLWGLVDKYNWQYLNGSDFPNLFSVDYHKKSAYAGFIMGLSDQ